jgi:hypothetical protein
VKYHDVVNSCERWCGRNRRWILTTILFCAALIRIVHFVEIQRSPCVSHHQWDQGDMHTYHLWGESIARGDWLTDSSFHPLHRWHYRVASIHLRENPADGDPDDPAAAARLWEAWAGGTRFHAEPLYAYLVGLTYRLARSDVRWVFAWQSALGMASILLIFLIASRIFGDLAATVAAALAVLCGPLLFYEMVLLRTTLITFTGLALVWVILWAERAVSPRRWLATGLAFGAAILVKTVFLLPLPGLLGLMAHRHWRMRTPMLWPGAALVLGVLLAFAPLVARNLAVGAPPLALSSVNATAFAMSNGKHYEPRLNRIDLKEIARIMGASNGRFAPAVIETMRTHETPVDYAKLAWGKLDALWHGYEMPNNVSFYYHRLYSRTLRLLPVTFYLISPLALVGLALLRGRFEPSLPLLLLIGSHVLVGLAALSQSRYRMPLVAALLPVAAWALVRIFELLRNRRLVRAATAVVAALLLGLWTSRPLPAEVKPIRDVDCTALLRWHREAHGIAAARDYLLTVLAVAPRSVGTLVSLGDVERHDGHPEQAVAYYESALELDADNRHALRQLGRLYEALGQAAKAQETRRKLRSP